MSQQPEGGSSDRSELESKRWIDMWDGGLLPGQAFDACTASPLLLQYIAENKIPHGKALVPGCGRGYDVTALADEHRYVLGLDIAPKAVEAARFRLDMLSSDECKYKPNAHFATTSFFELNEQDGLYDFIYDYTFLCALHPSVRPMWAQKMSRLVRADGVLLTLIFPIREMDDHGPPYAVSLDLLRQVRTAAAQVDLLWHIVHSYYCCRNNSSCWSQSDSNVWSFGCCLIICHTRAGMGPGRDASMLLAVWGCGEGSRMVCSSG